MTILITADLPTPRFTLDYYLDPTYWNHDALYYQVQEMGNPAFLVRRENKRPFETGGFHNATTDLNVIDTSWERYGSHAMPAIPTGQVSGLLVWDIDMKNGKDGLKSLREIEEQLGEKLPWKYVIETTTGGFHAYFRLKPEQSFPSTAGTIAEGIDIRCEGGYVVAEGAINADGLCYTAIVTEEIPYLPNAFAEFLAEAKAKKRILINTDGMIPEGARNQSLFLIVASMRAKGLEGQKLLGFAIWANANLCFPPLPHDEVVKIVQSAGTYGASYTHDTTPLGFRLEHARTPPRPKRKQGVQ